MGNIKITIITVNLNNLSGLIKTVNSVVNQTYENIEFIVIDGASTDGSAEFIVTQNQDIDISITEIDTGIYNAMNKGIRNATGEYLLFLNSGDSLASSNVIRDIFEVSREADIIYGNAIYKYSDEHYELRKMPSNLNAKTLINRTLNHQSMFFKNSLFSNGNVYDERYKIVADWVFYCNEILLKNKTYLYINQTVGVYDFNGISSSKEGQRIMQSERKKYYIKNAYVFIESFIELYEQSQSSYNLLKSKPIIRIMFKAKSLLEALKSGLSFNLNKFNRTNIRL